MLDTLMRALCSNAAIRLAEFHTVPSGSSIHPSGRFSSQSSIGRCELSPQFTMGGHDIPARQSPLSANESPRFAVGARFHYRLILEIVVCETKSDVPVSKPSRTGM